MKTEDNIVNQGVENGRDKKGNLIPPYSEKTEEDEIRIKLDEINKQEFLSEQGIDLAEPWQIAEMSFSQVISYQKDIKNKIFEVQSNLPPKDFEASRAIFDEALKQVDVVKTPDDLKSLKREVRHEENKKTIDDIGHESDIFTAAHAKFRQDHPERYYPNKLPENMFRAAAAKKKKKK